MAVCCQIAWRLNCLISGLCVRQHAWNKRQANNSWKRDYVSPEFKPPQEAIDIRAS